MNYTKNDFIMFCKMFEEANGFEYDDNNLTETETGYKYMATFRDEYNYKISVNLFLDGTVINWDEPKFYEDEEYDTKPFFHDLINEVFQDFQCQIQA